MATDRSQLAGNSQLDTQFDPDANAAARGGVAPLGRDYLILIAPDWLEYHLLPQAGEVTIGRSSNSEVKVGGHLVSISRRHAVLGVGDRLTLKNLSTSSVTQVRNAALACGVPMEIQRDEAFDLGRVMAVVRRLARAPEHLRLDPDHHIVALETLPSGVTGESPMGRMLRLSERVAPSRANLLVLGETGVGKEVLANRIHELSPRRNKRFVAVSCTFDKQEAQRLEDELFGHKKGSFTGAIDDRPGLFEHADGGTLLLDEVGELPLELQAKLLRIIEYQRVRRFGENQERAVDVRILSATNRNLEQEVAAGRFREDLLARLDVFRLVIPPLRDRVAEIEPLARRFLAEVCARERLPTPRLAPETLSWMRSYSWPRNVRELRNRMERAAIACGGEPIEPQHLFEGPLPSTQPLTQPVVATTTTPATGEEALPARPDKGPPAREDLLVVLHHFRWNQRRVAEHYGVVVRTVINWRKHHGVPGPHGRRERPTSHLNRRGA